MKTRNDRCRPRRTGRLLTLALAAGALLWQPGQAAATPANPERAAVQVIAARTASTVDGGFALTATDLSDPVAELTTALPTQGVQNLLSQADKSVSSGTACATDPFGAGDGGIAPLAPAVKYCWSDDDALNHEWIPQGITGVSDAQADEYWGTKRPLIASWYDDSTACTPAGTAACADKGVRLSFLDPATAKYRHVLLAAPYYNSYGHISYRAINIHGGGIAWYKYRLYVTDTLHGLRVFDLRNILDLDPDRNPSTNNSTPDGLSSNVQDNGKVGRQSNVWYSYGYRYVLPQVGSYDFVSAQYNSSAGTCESSGAPKASYLSVDRSSSPPQLIMGEYCTTDSTHPDNGRIGALPIDDADGSLLANADGLVSAVGTYALPVKQVQGASRYAGRWYLNQSHRYSNASLWRAAVGGDGDLAVTGGEIRTAVGAEDMYYEHGQATGAAPLLWSQSEHRADINDPSCAATGPTPDPTPCGRVIYAHRVSDILTQP
ncbi:hypothetical protein ACWCV9_35200 [Streptomyces sp. NPDC001606]